MKRFSVLVLLIAIIFSTASLLYKQTHYTEVKETEYDTQEIKRDGNCATVTDNVKFVSDTNVSDKREKHMEQIIKQTYENFITKMGISTLNISWLR